MTKSPTALDVNRRGFLGMLFGTVAAVAAAPVMAKLADSKWGDMLRRLRGIVSANPVTRARNLVQPGDLADAFAQVERHDLRVRHVYMHPDTYAQARHDYARGRPHDAFDEDGEDPKLWGAEVHLTDEVSRKQVYVTSTVDDPRGVVEIRVVS